MKRFRKIFLQMLLSSVILAAACLTGSCSGKKDFQYWEPGAESLKALKTYVSDVTRTGSESFIPEEDRIAVFDLDGTLYGEKAPIYIEWWMFVYRVLKDPTFEASEELIETAGKIEEAVQSGVIPDDLELKHAIDGAKAFAGMTVGEYKAYVNTFLLKEAEGFEGLNYSEAFYLPMIEVVDYLNQNGFTVYICSGTDRFMCRALTEGVIDIPARQIIGMDVLCTASGQGETDGLDYVYTANDDVVRTEQLIIKNVKANKVSQIIQEIGQKPVLSFGNSSGDTSMAMYTTSGNPYKSMAFMVVADDTAREYGDPEKAAELREKWTSNGWVSISMKDDWNTIYGGNVRKAGQE